MLRRDLFERTEGFGEVATGQDWWLMLRCIEAGAKMGYLPEVHVRQYLHSGERLSLGQNKIDGESARHAKVREYYYPLLSKKERRYVGVPSQRGAGVRMHAERGAWPTP